MTNGEEGRRGRGSNRMVTGAVVQTVRTVWRCRSCSSSSRTLTSPSWCRGFSHGPDSSAGHGDSPQLPYIWWLMSLLCSFCRCHRCSSVEVDVALFTQRQVPAALCTGWALRFSHRHFCRVRLREILLQKCSIFRPPSIWTLRPRWRGRRESDSQAFCHLNWFASVQRYRQRHRCLKSRQNRHHPHPNPNPNPNPNPPTSPPSSPSLPPHTLPLPHSPPPHHHHQPSLPHPSPYPWERRGILWTWLLTFWKVKG